MKTAEELFQAAEKIYHQYSIKRYPKAIRAFKALLEAYPGHVQGWSMLSTMQAANKEFDAALFSLDQAIQLADKPLPYQEQKKLLFSELSYLEYDGEKYFDEDSDGFYTLNTFKNRAELLRAYIDCLQQLLPELPEAEWEDRAEQYDKIGSLEQSLENYSAAEQAYQKGVKCLLASGEDFEKGFFNPLGSSYLSLAKLYELQEKWTAALEHYDLAIEQDDDHYLLSHKAKLYGKMGDEVNKKATYQMFLAESEAQFEQTGDSTYLFHKITAYLDLNDWEAANQTCERLEALDNLSAYTQEQVQNYRKKIEAAKPT